MLSWALRCASTKGPHYSAGPRTRSPRRFQRELPVWRSRRGFASPPARGLGPSLLLCETRSLNQMNAKLSFYEPNKTKYTFLG